MNACFSLRSPWRTSFILLALGASACSRASYPALVQAPLPTEARADAPAPAPNWANDSLTAMVVARLLPGSQQLQLLAKPVRTVRPRPAHPRPTASRLPLALRQVLAATRPLAPPDQPAPVRYRSRGIAFLMDLVMLVGPFTLVLAPVSLALIFYNYYFYLGRYPQGITSILLLILSFALLLAGFDILRASSNPEANLVGAILLTLWAGWHLVNMVRILTGHLKPKDGDYYPRFFQTNSTPNSAAPPAK